MWGVSRSFRRGKVYRDPIIGTMGTGARIFRVKLEMRREHTRTSGWYSLTLASTSSISVEMLAWIIAGGTIVFVACVLTVAVIHVDNSVLVLQSLRNTANEALRALGRSVDGDKTEWALGSRHDDVKCKERKIIESVATSWGFYFTRPIASPPFPTFHFVG